MYIYLKKAYIFEKGFVAITKTGGCHLHCTRMKLLYISGRKIKQIIKALAKWILKI